MGRNCSGQDAASREPKPGVSVRFADPGKNGLEAEVFWRAEDYRRVVSARVRNCCNPGLGDVVCLAEVQCRKTLLKTVSGEQQLLFRSAQKVAQLRCVGADIGTTPFTLEIVVDNFPDVEGSQRLIRRLADLYRNRLLGGPNKERTVEATRHRDALIALDLSLLGYRYRDIARVIHGNSIVDGEWSDPNRTLKNRVIRSYKRGIRMMNGGYRSLLR